MRAPVEGCGLWALGSAMNELADQLRVDPIELRLTNHADVHPFTAQPWSSKKLRDCYEEGARAFGWRRRPSEPERDGPWLVGQGMSDCAMGTFRFASGAHVRLRADGRAVIQTGTQDIGTGIVTILTQIVCGVLGLEPGLVTCEIGDTELPEAGPTFGSSSTIGVGAAVLGAAEDALVRLRERSGHALRRRARRRRRGGSDARGRARGAGRRRLVHARGQRVRVAYVRRDLRRGGG